MSKFEVQMLDLTVSKCRFRPGVLQWRPFFKPSARAVPLSMSSCHNKMVHSWARSGLNRLARNSFCSLDFEEAKAKYVSDLATANLEDLRILDILLYNPFQNHALASKHAFKLSRDFNTAEDVVQITLILDHHPNWSLGNLQAKINSFCARHNHFCMLHWGRRLMIRTAWRNSGPTLALSLRNL